MISETHQNLVILQYFIKAMKIKIVSRKGLKTIFNFQPFKDNISVFKHALKELNIYSVVIEINPGQLQELPLPVIARYDSNYFVVITDIDTDNVSYFDGSKKHKISTETVKKLIDYCVIAFLDEESKELRYKQNLYSNFAIKTIYLFSAILVLCLLSKQISQILEFNVGQIAILVLKLCGILLSFLILKMTYNPNNKIAKKYCYAEQNSGCELILSSNQKILGVFSWTELGFIYFLGTFLILFFENKGVSTLSFFALLNLPTVFFSIYSVWYQKVILKKWCKFCLLTLLIFLSEFFVFLTISESFVYGFITISTIKYLGYLALVSISWLWYCRLFEKNIQLELQLDNANTIKYDHQIFNTLLLDQPKLENSPPSVFQILKGECKNSITIILSLSCNACSGLVETIEEYIHGAYHDFEINIIFFNKENDLEYLEATIYDLYKKYKSHKSPQLLIDQVKLLYGHGAKDTLSKLVVKNHEDDFFIQNKKVQDWIASNNINKVPVVFLNDYQLPEAYNLNDLKYFL